jgi:aldehyde dehydrogenase (NAD+)
MTGGCDGIFGRAQCYVDGAWSIPSGDPAATVIDPFTEQPIGEVAEAGGPLVEKAVLAAANAQAAWAGLELGKRLAVLEGAADALDREGSALAATVTREMGMPVTLATVTQAQLPARVLRAAAQTAREFPWRQAVPGATLVRRPAGVAAAITPWNMPVYQIILKLSAALAAGCTVVLKASEMTPFDAMHLVGIFESAGCPAGVLNLVTGTGPVTGRQLVADRRIRHVSFTGSVRGGRQVAALAAANITRCTLELGGKSPAVILPDADLALAVRSALGSGLVNSGQACNAPSRMLVPQTAFDDALQILASEAGQIAVGDPREPSTRMGPLASARQREMVLGYVRSAVADGGTLLCGTGAPSTASDTGYFVDPTVIAGLPRDARAAREEIFGPVVVVLPYRDEDDAAALANGTDYGLSAEVYSADRDHAERFARRLDCGQVKINGVRTRDRPDVPFGGTKLSGYGRELGALGLTEMTEVTAVMS